MLLSGTWMPRLLHSSSNNEFFLPICGVSSGIFLLYLELSMMMILFSMLWFLDPPTACASTPQSMHDWTFHDNPFSASFHLRRCQGCHAVIPLFMCMCAWTLGRCDLHQQWQQWNSSSNPYDAQFLWGLARHLDHTVSPHGDSNSYEYNVNPCIQLCAPWPQYPSSCALRTSFSYPGCELLGDSADYPFWYPEKIPCTPGSAAQNVQHCFLLMNNLGSIPGILRNVVRSWYL